MFAHRSIYQDGWRAVCPVPGPSFAEAGIGFGAMALTEDKLRELDAKHWELYDLRTDPTETNNLAAANRDKLIEMIATWYTEAGKYNVLPLDSRGQMRFADERPDDGRIARSTRTSGTQDRARKRRRQSPTARTHHGGRRHSQGGAEGVASHGSKCRRLHAVREGQEIALRTNRVGANIPCGVERDGAQRKGSAPP
jgi:hypothetical protein